MQPLSINTFIALTFSSITNRNSILKLENTRINIAHFVSMIQIFRSERHDIAKSGLYQCNSHDTYHFY